MAEGLIDEGWVEEGERPGGGLGKLFEAPDAEDKDRGKMMMIDALDDAGFFGDVLERELAGILFDKVGDAGAIEEEEVEDGAPAVGVETAAGPRAGEAVARARGARSQISEKEEGLVEELCGDSDGGVAVGVGVEAGV